MTVTLPAPSIESTSVCPGSRSKVESALPESEARRSKVTAPTEVSTRATKRRANWQPARWTKALPFQYSARVAESARRERAHGFCDGVPS